MKPLLKRKLNSNDVVLLVLSSAVICFALVKIIHKLIK